MIPIGASDDEDVDPEEAERLEHEAEKARLRAEASGSSSSGSSDESDSSDSSNKTKKTKDTDTTGLFAASYFRNNSFGYALVDKGTCESNGFSNIDGASNCSAAARNLKLPTYALQYVENGDPKTAKMASTCILKST